MILFPIEIKSGETVTKDYFKNLERYIEFAGGEATRSTLIYAGTKEQKRQNTDVIGWKSGTFERARPNSCRNRTSPQRHHPYSQELFQIVITTNS